MFAIEDSGDQQDSNKKRVAISPIRWKDSESAAGKAHNFICLICALQKLETSWDCYMMQNLVSVGWKFSYECTSEKKLKLMYVCKSYIDVESVD